MTAQIRSSSQPRAGQAWSGHDGDEDDDNDDYVRKKDHDDIDDDHDHVRKKDDDDDDDDYVRTAPPSPSASLSGGSFRGAFSPTYGSPTRHRVQIQM